MTVPSSSGIVDGALLVVYRQPMALDRFTAHDVTATEPLGKFRDDNGSAGHGSRVKWVNKSEWVTWVTGQ